MIGCSWTPGLKLVIAGAAGRASWMSRDVRAEESDERFRDQPLILDDMDRSEVSFAAVGAAGLQRGPVSEDGTTSE